MNQLPNDHPLLPWLLHHVLDLSENSLGLGDTTFVLNGIQYYQNLGFNKQMISTVLNQLEALKIIRCTSPHQGISQKRFKVLYDQLEEYLFYSFDIDLKENQEQGQRHTQFILHLLHLGSLMSKIEAYQATVYN